MLSAKIRISIRDRKTHPNLPSAIGDILAEDPNQISSEAMPLNETQEPPQCVSK